MGFFKDFKEDLSQAVGELEEENFGGDKQETAVQDDMQVNTLDEEADAAAEFDLAAAVAEVVADEENAEQETVEESEEETVEEETFEEVGNAAEESEEDIDTDEVADETALITKGLTVTGDLNAEGSIEIDGAVEGNVTCRGKLTVSGSITGNSRAMEVFASNAGIEGNIAADGSVKIAPGTVVIGNISAVSAVIAGAVKGDIDVHGPVVVDSSAVIVGDIKSRSVQINNGATIDGRCSQCYAETDINSVFASKKKK